MKTQIKLNDKVGIDIPKGISGKLLLQAGSGGGKSFTIRRVLEDSYGTIPHIVLDTEGEFASLREKYDYILIGKGQDIVPDPRTAGLMALRLWQEKVSAIIDLYELDPKDRQLFVDNFLNAMINAPKPLWKPVLLVIDEAHEYAPENERTEHGLGMSRLASKGRKRHIFAIFATQSIALLSKRIVASCKNKLIGYASEINDVKRAAFELGFTPNEALKLRDLDPGEFYAFGPAISKEIIKVKIGPVKTTHEGTSSAKYKVAPPSAKVKAALVKLADLPQAAAEEAKTTAEFKAQITDLKRQLREAPKAAPVAMGVSQWLSYGEKYGYLDFFKNKYAGEFKKQKQAWYQKLLKSHGYITNVSELLKSLEVELHPAFPALKEAMDTVVKNPKILEHPASVLLPIKVKAYDPKANFERQEVVGITKGETLMLKAIAGDAGGITVEHVMVVVGYKRTSTNEYIRQLIAKGLVERRGDLLVATENGIAQLGSDYEALPTGYDLRDYWLKKLPEGERKIFAVICEEGRATRDQIMELTDYKRTSTNEYLRKLKARKLVVEMNNDILLSDNLS